MDAQQVSTAIATLKAQGETPSVRKIHALLGGSFRDISTHLHDLLPQHTTGEDAMVTPELDTAEDLVSETAPRLGEPWGTIAQAQAALEFARQQSAEVHAQYVEACSRVRQLRDALIPQHPDEQAAHQAELFQAVREVESLAMPRASAQLGCDKARATLQRLEQRRTELEQHLLPRLRRELAQILGEEAANEQHIDFLVRSDGRASRDPKAAEALANQQRLAFQERVQRWRRAIAEAEHELAQLDGIQL